MMNFMENPLGDTPWEEETGAEDVQHVNTDRVSDVFSWLCVFG